MKIPKKLKINGLTYGVILEKDVTYQGNAYGITHHDKQKIYISSDQEDDRQAVTLLHEILHAVINASHLYPMFTKESMPDDAVKAEENVVTAIALSLYQVLKDNKVNFGE